LAVGLAVAVGATAATTRHAVTLANSVTYQDSTGESPNALDIGTVTVSNNDAGLLTFDLKFANRSPNPATDLIMIGIDSDRNPSTGNPGWLGSEWLVNWWGDSVLRQWDGSKMVNAPSMSTLVSTVAPNELVLRLNRSELGSLATFDFVIEAQVWPADPNAEEPTAWDDAPDYGHGAWSYDVKLYVAPALSATAIKCTPDPPRAGKPMIAHTTVTIMRGSTREQLDSNATVVATATIAGKKIVGTVTPSYATGKVAVRWLVPKTAAGKLMNGKITVTLEKVSVTKTFRERVK
jgi:hypothetical protein